MKYKSFTLLPFCSESTKHYSNKKEKPSLSFWSEIHKERYFLILQQFYTPIHTPQKSNPKRRSSQLHSSSHQDIVSCLRVEFFSNTANQSACTWQQHVDHCKSPSFICFKFWPSLYGLWLIIVIILIIMLEAQISDRKSCCYWTFQLFKSVSYQ